MLTGAGVVVSLTATLLAGEVADRPADSDLRVTVRLTAADDLPALARAGLIAEAEAIWHRAGVQLRWAPAIAHDPTRPTLRVLVMRREASAVADHTWPVGELIRAQDGVPFAVVSTTAARRVVEALGQRHEPQALTDRRLGVVLGRAVAHELGHYLLATRDHAASGLMRAHVDVTEFADLRRGGFFLDRDARAWILASSPHAPAETAATSRFSYLPPR